MKGKKGGQWMREDGTGLDLTHFNFRTLAAMVKLLGCESSIIQSTIVTNYFRYTLILVIQFRTVFIGNPGSEAEVPHTNPSP